MTDINDSKVIPDRMASLGSVKAVYDNLYRTVADKLTKFLDLCPTIIRDVVSENIKLSDLAYLDLNNYNNDEIIKAYDFFLFKWLFSCIWRYPKFYKNLRILFLCLFI